MSRSRLGLFPDEGQLCQAFPSHSQSLSFFSIFLKYLFLFAYLAVLGLSGGGIFSSSMGTLSYGMWDLVP